MFDVKYTTRFKKDYKLLKKRGYDMNKLLDVIDILREGRELPPQYKDHPLHGDYEGQVCIASTRRRAYTPASTRRISATARSFSSSSRKNARCASRLTR